MDEMRDNRGFPHADSLILRAALEGAMGHIRHADGCAEAIVGDVRFLSGKPAHTEPIKGFIKSMDYDTIVLMEEAWRPFLEEYHAGTLTWRERYSFAEAPREPLPAPVLPEGYAVLPVGAALARQAMATDWADLGANYRSLDDFLARGLGYAAVREGEGVCFASAYTACSEGISIQIDTRTDHRRRGLARACAAQLINECLRRRLYPEWDADNEASRALAISLGYRESRPYKVYTLVKG